MKKFLYSIGYILCLLSLFIALIPGIVVFMIVVKPIIFFAEQTRYPIGGITSSMKESFMKSFNSKRKETMQ